MKLKLNDEKVVNKFDMREDKKKNQAIRRKFYFNLVLVCCLHFVQIRFPPRLGREGSPG